MGEGKKKNNVKKEKTKEKIAQKKFVFKTFERKAGNGRFEETGEGVGKCL